MFITLLYDCGMSIGPNCDQYSLSSATASFTQFVAPFLNAQSACRLTGVLIPSGDDSQHLQVNGGVSALKKRTGNNSAMRSGSKSGEACPLLLGCKLAEQTISTSIVNLSASFCVCFTDLVRT